MSPPCRFGAKDPVARLSLSQRIAVEGAIPKRAAAARRLRPPSIAEITRSLKSMESGLPIVAPKICLGVNESNHRQVGNPQSTQIVGKTL